MKDDCVCVFILVKGNSKGFKAFGNLSFTFIKEEFISNQIPQNTTADRCLVGSGEVNDY